MRLKTMRTASVVLGMILLLVGLVWIGQGLDLIPGSFMTGNRTWFYTGLVMALVGAVLIILGKRKGSTARNDRVR